jgi:uncharacterized membrane protein YdjX (TVP38/TMEM64 family)
MRIAGPILLLAIPIQLDAIVIGVAKIERFADAMITGAVQLDARINEPLQRAGVAIGATLTVVGATVGATILFLIARSAVGDALRQRAGPFLARMSEGFSRNAFNYLLFLRLVPAFPFWAVNLAPALLGMRLLPYVIATFIGIIPATVVFSAFGASLGAVFDAGGDVNLKDVLSPTLLATLVVLGLLSLLPVLLKGRARQQG